MVDSVFILNLIVLLLLAGYLIQRHVKRLHLGQLARQQRVPVHGHTIDLASVRPRLDALKRDFAGEAHSRAGSARARAGLVAVARARLGATGFFKHAPDESEGGHPAQ